MISWVVILSIAIYLVFNIWDKKQIKDERSQLIELKASEIQNKVTLWALVLSAIIYWLNPETPAWFFLIIINIGNLYSEIFGKLYFRSKI